MAVGNFFHIRTLPSTLAVNTKLEFGVTVVVTILLGWVYDFSYIGAHGRSDKYTALLLGTGNHSLCQFVPIFGSSFSSFVAFNIFIGPISSSLSESSSSTLSFSTFVLDSYNITPLIYTKYRLLLTLFNFNRHSKTFYLNNYKYDNNKNNFIFWTASRQLPFPTFRT